MAAPAIGVFLPTMAERGGALGDVAGTARHAEELGFESAWAVDQLVSGTGVPIIDSTVDSQRPRPPRQHFGWGTA